LPGRHQKEYLPLNVYGNFAPSLLEALNRLERCSQQVCHLFLRLLELLTQETEFFVVQGISSFSGAGEKIILLKIPQCGIVSKIFFPNKKFGRMIWTPYRPESTGEAPRK
jgi:hypothetical protein